MGETAGRTRQRYFSSADGNLARVRHKTAVVNEFQNVGKTGICSKPLRVREAAAQTAKNFATGQFIPTASYVEGD
jgi:hypothetical protein